jgi:hypothetical protein
MISIPVLHPKKSQQTLRLDWLIIKPWKPRVRRHLRLTPRPKQVDDIESR